MNLLTESSDHIVWLDMALKMSNISVDKKTLTKIINLNTLVKEKGSACSLQDVIEHNEATLKK